MKFLLTIFTLLFFTAIYSQEFPVEITADGMFPDADTTSTPELDVLSSFEDTTFEGDLTRHTICKIEYDFNFDGINDIALTDQCTWGAHIGPWAIYLGNENKSYFFLDNLWFHNDAVKIDSVAKGTSRIYVYDKIGGEKVDIVELLLSSAGIKVVNHEVIYPDSEIMNEDYLKAQKLFFEHPGLEEFCLNVSDYIETKKMEWKKR